MRLLSLLCGCTALSVALCATPALAADEHAPHWTYEGHGGPAEWGKLAENFATCEKGSAQSPIDLAGAIPAKLAKIDVSYQPQPLTVLNNGHTIQVNFQPGNSLTLEGDRYDLLQYHFHHPSEHTINGKPAPMEVHLVHKSAKTGALAVLGVMMVPGKANPTIEAVWQAMPTSAGPEQKVDGVSLNPDTLLPASRSYWRYEGSLTTPPCCEVVHWVNLKDPIEVSQAQLDRFATLFPLNARPVQPQNRRFLLDSDGK